MLFQLALEKYNTSSADISFSDRKENCDLSAVIVFIKYAFINVSVQPYLF